ncbi:hypothetical protein OGAPHI_003884 [Ogataea philodendri]|uniref:Uncharacterized protein n=1 Tax=Ogataea philodendri TaxID=1378263 RepID=A0A9P8P5Z6_9ASCO|nr:uncharacterized protein OGAPHI_003884 [Ogataea philodendri]KAH3665696.1 hypothetical protein OGAPHI_003884 [Ogataea philodendri]
MYSWNASAVRRFGFLFAVAGHLRDLEKSKYVLSNGFIFQSLVSNNLSLISNALVMKTTRFVANTSCDSIWPSSRGSSTLPICKSVDPGLALPTRLFPRVSFSCLSSDDLLKNTGPNDSTTNSSLFSSISELRVCIGTGLSPEYFSKAR